MQDDCFEELALLGGPKAKCTPLPQRTRHGEVERRYLSEVIDSGVLFYFLGTKVFDFQNRFAEMWGKRYCIACSSGTAAIHMAVAALELPPGSEVITSSITDMGTLTGILYQGLVPVFADVDPYTLNISPDSVRNAISSRTRAIVVVHHSGLAADMDALLSIGSKYGLPIIEDCAQAYCCEYKGKLTGTMGIAAAFSLNHFKHITCGSGGMLLTDDERIRYHASLFLDKCYQRGEGLRNPFFLAPNYQMTELQGAVALAQLERVHEIVAARKRLGNRLTTLLAEVPGVRVQHVPDGCSHTYFLYLFRLELDQLRCNAREFAEALKAEGVPNSAHLITGGKPVYLYDIFQHRSAFPGSLYPFGERTYPAGLCPVAEDAFKSWITMNIYENYSSQDIDEIVRGIAKVAYHYREGR